VLAATALLALGATPALAGTGHKYVGALGSPGGGGGSGDFSGPQGVATDSSNGDLFVAEVWNGRIQELTASGDPVTAWGGSGTPASFFNGVSGVAVDSAHDRVYVTEQLNNVVDVFDRSGAYITQLAAPAPYTSLGAIAVDTASGDVFVVDSGASQVDVFDASGAYQGWFGSAGSADGQFSGPAAIAVDPTSHDVYVVDTGNARVERFDSTGAFVSTLAGTQNPNAVAVDPANEDVYVGESGASGQQVARYDSSGARLYDFGQGHLGGIGGLATSLTGHRVYATDTANNVVAIFAPVTMPDVTTGAASAVGATDATLNGTVNTQNTTAWAVYFDYGTDTGYGSQAYDFTDSFPPSTSDAPAAAAVGGLKPNATYHYRLAAQGPNGTVTGADQTFTTDPAPPVVDGTSAAPVGTITATLHAQVNANNSATTYHFEYGSDTSYGTSTPDASAGSGYGDQDSTADITGLQPDTVYHFRVVADNGTGGPVTSADKTFKTAPADPPTATDVTGKSALLRGVADVRGPGTYHFEYGTDTSYGTSTPEASAPPVSGDQTLTAPVKDLAPATTYHFRLVSSANGNTTVTADGTLSTMTPATVTTADATDVATSSVALHGKIDSHGHLATYRFLVTGVGSPVHRATLEQAITSTSPTGVGGAVADLPDNGTYQVVLSATVGGVESHGDPVTFTTPKLQALAPRTSPTDAHAYGCDAPHLDQPTLPATADKAYTLTGSDLGLGGQLTINGARRFARSWSAGAITLIVPDDATGSLTIGVDCGTASNTVTITIPSNAFTIVSAKVKGSVATITANVPGPGALTAQGSHLRTTTKTATKAGRTTVTFTLTPAGKRALRHAEHHRLRVILTVRYTPTGGPTATQHRTVAFTRK
jgi:DNA-binding beta-propeller fold protein YncE